MQYVLFLSAGRSAGCGRALPHQSGPGDRHQVRPGQLRHQPVVASRQPVALEGHQQNSHAAEKYVVRRRPKEKLYQVQSLINSSCIVFCQAPLTSWRGPNWRTAPICRSPWWRKVTPESSHAWWTTRKKCTRLPSSWVSTELHTNGETVWEFIDLPVNFITTTMQRLPFLYFSFFFLLSQQCYNRFLSLKGVFFF